MGIENSNFSGTRSVNYELGSPTIADAVRIAKEEKLRRQMGQQKPEISIQKAQTVEKNVKELTFEEAVEQIENEIFESHKIIKQKIQQEINARQQELTAPISSEIDKFKIAHQLQLALSYYKPQSGFDLSKLNISELESLLGLVNDESEKIIRNLYKIKQKVFEFMSTDWKITMVYTGGGITQLPLSRWCSTSQHYDFIIDSVNDTETFPTRNALVKLSETEKECKDLCYNFLNVSERLFSLDSHNLRIASRCLDTTCAQSIYELLSYLFENSKSGEWKFPSRKIYNPLRPQNNPHIVLQELKKSIEKVLLLEYDTGDDIGIVYFRYFIDLLFDFKLIDASSVYDTYKAGNFRNVTPLETIKNLGIAI
ncbi:MAG: hypothetical protein OHK0017_05220 [Patescibacteria group bacterium]